MIANAQLVLIAVVLVLATVALGAFVSSRPLTALDRAAIALRKGSRRSVFFTRAGYWPALTVLSAVLFAVEYAVRGGVAFAIALGAMQLLAQGAANVLKEIFRRKRPDDWLFHQELGFSFPSGHATTAVTFYGGLLIFVWMLPLPNAELLLISVMPAIFIAGIPWSRMALSAHYATDVLGGLLLGGAGLALLVALYAEARFL